MRYTGPKCRLCRKEGVQLFLKGERCRSQKCSALKKNYPPGDHGKMFKKKSEYGKQLREKKKTESIYGITGKVMKSYFEKAQKMSGDTSQNLLTLLYVRLDNIIYLSGLVESRNTARQLISHGFFKINNKRVKTPSINIKKGDIISLKDEQPNESIFGDLKKQKIKSPNWLRVDYKNIKCEILDIPKGKDLSTNIDTQLIIGFYSRF